MLIKHGGRKLESKVHFKKIYICMSVLFVCNFIILDTKERYLNSCILWIMRRSVNVNVWSWSTRSSSVIYPEENHSTVFGTGLQHFSQAIPKGTRKGPELHIHTCVTMADLQMKLLRKKIQKRNENRKKRKLLSKQQEQEDAGMYLEILKSVVDSARFWELWMLS